jgi:hypothetical protein
VLICWLHWTHRSKQQGEIIMATTQDIIKGYAGFKTTPSGWLSILRDDARIMSATGRHDVARLLMLLASQYAARIIGAGI